MANYFLNRLWYIFLCCYRVRTGWEQTHFLSILRGWIILGVWLKRSLFTMNGIYPQIKKQKTDMKFFDNRRKKWKSEVLSCQENQKTKIRIFFSFSLIYRAFYIFVLNFFPSTFFNKIIEYPFHLFILFFCY